MRALHPFLRNLTENIAAVQFDHRLLATATGAADVGRGAMLLACAAVAVTRRWLGVWAGWCCCNTRSG